MKKRVAINIIYSILLSLVAYTVIMSLESYNTQLKYERDNLYSNIKILSELLKEEKDIKAIFPLIYVRERGADYYVYKDEVLYFSTSKNENSKNIIGEKIRDINNREVKTTESYFKNKGKGNTYYLIEEAKNSYMVAGSFQYTGIFEESFRILPYAILPLILGLLLIPNIKKIIEEELEENLNSIGSNIKNFSIKGYSSLDVDEEFEDFLQVVKSETEEIHEYLIKRNSQITALNKVTKDMLEGFIIIDGNKAIQAINESAIKLLEAPLYVDYTEKDILTLCRDSKFQNILNEALERENNYIGNLYISNKYLKLYINPVYSRKNELFGMVILIVDESDTHQLEKMRREFSTNVSHELKTPLTSIMGYAEMLNSSMVDKEHVEKFSHIIVEESKRLITLIESIISISRLEENKFEEETTEINLYQMATDVGKLLSLLMKEKNIDFELTGDKSIVINANYLMIEELFYNLIDNGISYNVTNGFIKVNITLDFKDNILLTFEDSGIGISYAEQEKIFQRFYMVDKSRSYNKKSTGLGLAIVKHIVEFYNGKIKIESQLNLGSKFIIELPKELKK